MADIAIRLEDLTRDFGTVRAVDGLSLQIPQGAIFGFLGPNGAGKTTTIRLLLGLLEPTEGKANVLGMDTVTEADGIRERSGALLEHTGLYERMSAAENLEYYARIWHIPEPDRSARIKELLDQAGLWDRRGEVVQGWSRGMKQKLAIARVLIHRPSIVFLDEPTAGLDPVAASELRDHLKELTTQQGITVFLTTHNLSEAEKLCSQVGVIRNGRLLAEGEPRSLRGGNGSARVEVVADGLTEELCKVVRQRPEVASARLEDRRLFLDMKDGISHAPLISLMVNSGVLIEEVRKVDASLEEAFLALMEDQR